MPIPRSTVSEKLLEQLKSCQVKVRTAEEEDGLPDQQLLQPDDDSDEPREVHGAPATREQAPISRNFTPFLRLTALHWSLQHGDVRLSEHNHQQ